jgi:hypothetical protein
MRTAIAKSRYKNPVGVFVALRPSEPEHPFFQPDKIPDSLYILLTGIPPIGRTLTDVVRVSDGTDQCPFIRLDVPTILYQGVPMDCSSKSKFNTLLTLKIRVGGTSRGMMLDRSIT